MVVAGSEILALTPCEVPAARMVVAAFGAGVLGVLDVGRDEVAGRAALAEVQREVRGAFGVRIPSGVHLDPATLPPQVTTVVVPFGADPSRFAPRRTLVE